MQITLKNVSKQFGACWAVRDLTLSLAAGQITAFLGPNGAGKTTTLKMLVGLLAPTEGAVYFGNQKFLEDPVKFKQRMAYVPDFPFLYERLTGREFLDFIAGMYEIPAAEREGRIGHFIERFALREVEQHLIQQYSHGMRQRLVFCSALIRHPRVFVIDEPMVGLDPKTTRIFKDMLIDLARQGVTVFLSTHQLAVAEELADQIAIIHKGKLLLCSSLRDLREQDGTFTSLENFFLSRTEDTL